MVPFLHSQETNSIKQGDNTVNHYSETQWNCSTIFVRVWGCVHTYFFTSVFPWNQCLWKWGAGNQKTQAGTNYKWESCCPSAHCTGMLGWSLPCSQYAPGAQCWSLVEVGLETRIPPPWGRTSSTLLLDPGTSPGLTRASSTPGREKG